MLEKYKVYYRTLFVVFWATTCYGFISDELLPFLDGLKSAFLALIDVVFLILGLTLIRSKRDVFILVSFVLISLLSSFVINRISFLHFLNGFRDFLGLLFALPIVIFFIKGPHAQDFKRRFDKQLFIWLCIQPFCLIWQCVKYGAGDHGGGSFGDLESGMCSMFIYLISFYLVYQKWDFNDYWGSVKKNKLYLFLLFPTYLNETKASFIYLALYLILLYKPTKASIVKLLYIIPIFIFIFIGIGKAYLKLTNQEDRSFDQAFFMKYFVGEEGEVEDIKDMYYRLDEGEFDYLSAAEIWAVDIPRFAKLFLMFDAIQDSKGGIIAGAGLGQFKGGTIFDSPTFYKQYPWLLIGSRPWMFFLFIQLGLLGFLWFFPTIWVQLHTGPKLRFPGNRMLLFLLFCLFLIMFYNDSLRKISECVIFFYFICVSRFLLFPKNESVSNRDNEKTVND